MTEDDDTIETTSSSAGERLRIAREEKGLSLEELASQTRIPLRHLQSLEQGDWSRLPAPTYTIGFAKSYASAVGLDRNEIAEELRAEMGGHRPDSTSAEVFQPVDPGRTMPKWLVLAAIGGIIVVVLLLSWLNERSLEGESAPAAEVASTEAAPQSGQAPGAQPSRPQPAPQAGGPVTIAAAEEAWVQVKDGGKTLFEGVMAPGQTYQVPSTATAPLLKAGKPEALRISVGSAVAPPVGPPGRVASNVSLIPSDLMKGGGAAGGTATVPAPSAPPGVQNSVE